MGEGAQYRLEAFDGALGLVPDLCQIGQVVGDLPVVPGEQDRLDIREVLVQRGPSDAGLLGDLRHRDRAHSALGGQSRGGVQNRVAHGAAVRLDRLVPHLRRQASLRGGDIDTP